MTPHLHPSEIRAPAPEKRAVRKRLRALQIGVAAAAVAASFAAAAYVVTQLPEEEPAPKVTFNRIEDWPEIKNGVPALAPPKPAPADPGRVRCSAADAGARAACGSSPAADFCGAPTRGGGCRRIGPARRAGRGRKPKRGAPLPGSGTAADRGERARRPGCGRAPEGRPSAQPKPKMPAGSAVAASAPASPAAAEATAPPVAPPAAKVGKARATSARDPCREARARPPPAKTAPVKTAKAKPRAAKVASAPPTEAPQAAPASPPAPPPEDDRVHVLGLSLPNLLPSGRKIREAVQSLGL